MPSAPSPARPPTRSAERLDSTEATPTPQVDAEDASEPSGPSIASFALYLEGTSLYAFSGAGVSLSYRPWRYFAVSGGFGVSTLLPFAEPSTTTMGGQFLGHLLLGGDGPGSFELAGGVAPVEVTTYLMDDQGQVAPGKYLTALPAAFLGYRRQPLDGGLLVRTGIGWSYGLGAGLSLSLGYAF